MAQWIKFQLNSGSVDGVQLVSSGYLSECHRPQFALPRGKPEWSGYTSRPTYPVTETRDTYGLGWYLGSYRGYRLSAHAGELFGYDSLLTLYREMGAGIYTAFNGPAGGQAYIANQLIHYVISDILLDHQQWLTLDTIKSFPEPWQPRSTHYYPRSYTEVTKGIAAAHPINDYVGRYHHDFLGSIQISTDEQTLCMAFGDAARCRLHPTGEDDDFRIEGVGAFAFIHQADIYAPSDWMTVHFHRDAANQNGLHSLSCALFESGPVFLKM